MMDFVHLLFRQQFPVFAFVAGLSPLSSEAGDFFPASFPLTKHHFEAEKDE